jgi:hypothetical protein
MNRRKFLQLMTAGALGAQFRKLLGGEVEPETVLGFPIIETDLVPPPIEPMPETQWPGVIAVRLNSGSEWLTTDFDGPDSVPTWEPAHCDDN